MKFDAPCSIRTILLSRPLWLAFAALLCNPLAHAQASPLPASQNAQNPASLPEANAPRNEVLNPQAFGSILGSVVYADGSVVVGAQVTLTQSNQASKQQVLSDVDGRFSFPSVAPGAFRLDFSASGFTAQTLSGTLQPGQAYAVAPVTLTLAPNITSVQVVASTPEIAQAEVKMEETQRVLGAFPNFYVSYVPDAAPLNAKQKFQLAWKTTIDPVTFGLVGAIAGVEQADGSFREYGPGAEGYGKRYGAAYADTVSGNFLGGAVFPSLFRQDPRYFYKGTGSVRSRLMYAIAMAVICRGDNKRWQFNYSGIMGGIAAGGVSNLYYPTQYRNGTELVFENTLIGIGASAAANIMQEFVIRHLTPKLPSFEPAKS